MKKHSAFTLTGQHSSARTTKFNRSWPNRSIRFQLKVVQISSTWSRPLKYVRLSQTDSATCLVDPMSLETKSQSKSSYAFENQSVHAFKERCTYDNCVTTIFQRRTCKWYRGREKPTNARWWSYMEEIWPKVHQRYTKDQVNAFTFWFWKVPFLTELDEHCG